MVLHEGGDYNKMLGIEPEHSVAATATPATTAEPAVKESWVHRHIYLATTIGVGGLLVLGGVLAMSRFDVDPARSSGAWGGAGGMFFGTIRNAAPTGPTADDVVRLQSPQDSYAAIPIYTPDTQDPENSGGGGAADIAALLAQLVQQTPVPAASSQPASSDEFSFIPQGLVSTEPMRKQRTAEQEDLFDYGNEVGTYVKAFEDTHYGSAQILKDHIEDRTNPDKIRALKILGSEMQQLGADLRNMGSVPEAAAGMHKVYGNAYYAAGANLILIADTKTDEEFVNAITQYNAVVEKLSTQFQLLSILFGTNEVTFSNADPGNIFMFNPNLSMLQ